MMSSIDSGCAIGTMRYEMGGLKDITRRFSQVKHQSTSIVSGRGQERQSPF